MTRTRRVVPKDTPMVRADQHTECVICGKFYRQHEIVDVADTYGPMTLIQTCDGRYYKL